MQPDKVVVLQQVEGFLPAVDWDEIERCQGAGEQLNRPLFVRL